MGLVPNSSGKIFGKEIHINKHGFRRMNSPANYNKSWLFLGDSVTFGVGVDTEQTFSQLIQNEFQHIKIWNTAVVGYSAINYFDVVEAFLNDHHDIDKVVLFFCLNGVYRNLSLSNRDTSKKEEILSFLGSNSKLYLLLKKFFFDRSKTYSLYDTEMYKKDSSKIDKYLNAVLNIKLKLDRRNIYFALVIIPYEYQLRVRGLKAPQVFLSDFFIKHDIKIINLYKDFTLLNSEDYFLYGDPMHLSALGHKIVAKKMIEILR